MCGIVGYVGHRSALDVVMDGLRRLEYRGYDSAGVALLDGSGGMQVERKAGRIENLEKLLGDTRHRAAPAWGTPGGPRTGRPPTGTPIRTRTARAGSR